MGIVIVWVVACGMFAFLGRFVAREKRRTESEGLLLGLVFGPVGCLIEAMLPMGDIKPKARAVEDDDDRRLGSFFASTKPEPTHPVDLDAIGRAVRKPRAREGPDASE